MDAAAPAELEAERQLAEALAQVAGRCERALQEAWASGRIAFPAQGKAPFQREVEAILRQPSSGSGPLVSAPAGPLFARAATPLQELADEGKRGAAQDTGISKHAAAEAAVGLALVIALFRNTHSVMTDDMDKLKDT